MKKIIKTLPKKIQSEHYVVYERIFIQQIDIFLNYTLEKYTDWLTKNKIKDISAKSIENFLGWTSDYETEDGKNKTIIFINKFQWTIQDQGTLIHEITHAIIRIWKRNNIPFNEDTQEFLAHSIANLYEDIAKKLLN